MAPMLQQCADCKVFAGEHGGKEKGLMQICGACRGGVNGDFSYCNTECQKLGWKDHKTLCRQTSVGLSQNQVFSLSDRVGLRCSAELREYTRSFHSILTIALDSAFNINTPNPNEIELASTHICVIHFDWNPNAVNESAEKQFTLKTIDILPDRDYEAWSYPKTVAELRKKESSSSGTIDPKAMLEAERRYGGIERQGLGLFVHMVLVVRDTIVGATIMRGLAQSQAIVYDVLPAGIPKRSKDLNWKEHLCFDLTRPPLLRREVEALSMQRRRQNPRPEVVEFLEHVHRAERSGLHGPQQHEIARADFLDKAEADRAAKSAKKKAKAKMQALR